MNTKNIFWIVIIAIVIIFSLRECSNYRATNSLLNNVVSYKDSVKTYRNMNGDLVAYNQTLEFENKKQLNAYLVEKNISEEELKKWKSISPAIIIKTEFKIKHDTILLKDTIPADFKPISFSEISADYALFGSIQPTFMVVDSLKIPNTQSILVGEKKLGWFKTEKRVEVTNSNPLIQTTNLGSFAINEKKKWYQTAAFKFGVGVVAGLTVSKFIVR